jgi:hypothetical protein
MGAREKLGILQHFAVIFSALIHDLDHPGNTNAFEVNSMSQRAVLYNDQSVLENHHCSSAFRLMDKKGLNLLATMPSPDLKDFRKMVIMCVLATDMAVHFQLIEEFSKKTLDGFWAVESPVDQLLFGKILVHAADLSNPVRQFDVAKRWSSRLSEEFNNQVDKEKSLGLPVLPFMITPDTVTLAKNEINFATFVVSPMWRAIAIHFTSLSHLVTQLESNIVTWKVVAEESSSSQSKVDGV